MLAVFNQRMEKDVELHLIAKDGEQRIPLGWPYTIKFLNERMNSAIIHPLIQK